MRVVLTPEARSLTVMEARMAAEQAFLEALKEPGLGDDLKRITVVVRLMPSSHSESSTQPSRWSSICTRAGATGRCLPGK